MQKIEETMQKAKKYFKEANETWADMEESNPAHCEHRHYSMKFLRPKGKTCLDLGCGWGRFLKSYRSHGAKRVVGLDLNPKNINRCKKISGVDLVRGDIERLPFTNGFFEVVSLIGTTEHLPDVKKAVKEIARVMNTPNGLASITWKNFNWFSALWDRNTRLRLVFSIRDFLGRILPFLRTSQYGLYRNSGFSVRTIHKLHQEGGLRILTVKRFPESFVLTISSHDSSRKVYAKE